MERTKYKSDFNKIQNLVNDFDICGFVKSGSPVYEYENLTNILLSLIYNNKSKLEIENELINEIENYYGMKNIENEISSEKLKTEIENLINKAKLEIKNKPSH
ncbi:hypothetical protein IA01_10655 [Flavobacterium psychrophilum]|uniref:Uncharacterized protein n=1 Tax=Flavobacterium psychrophilum (strain ATCC 49511 / DSM 21280 / CIP 103535 / JIP02/86) TaxID=402612 RepID=A6H1J4_FLAPJ|nr:hypothetical protein [Flavobacterium psychrophilum]AIG30895.1 hypothetical protein IA03_10635 [Flavobacterium psychrophilum]AIG33167.1 hypothetical protein IA01_10655 [Flavobacterium psychrophilum]AIG39954.1 hypothetical protein IA05_10630 [Flavobacterium psychrophilum]AIG42220.1 hypothetical protein IA06_10570 [Flavobacterium psychrophilum]AIJ37085.1 hypothetical protein FPSM_00590 [Flavobacterium psychrophilum]